MRSAVPSQSWRSLSTMSNGASRSMEVAKASTSILPAVRSISSSSKIDQAAPNEPASFNAIANQNSNQLSLETPRNNVGEYWH